MSTNLHNIVITAKRMIAQRKTPDEVHEYLEECLANVTKDDPGFYLEIGKLYLLLSLNKSFENRRNFLEKALVFCDRALEYIDTADVLALKCRLLGYLLACVNSELKLKERVRKTYEIHKLLTKLESKDSNHHEIPLIKGLMFFHISELPKYQLYGAIGFLKFFCCSSDNFKNLEKSLQKASYQKALDNLLKYQVQSIEREYFLADCYKSMGKKNEARRCFIKMRDIKKRKDRTVYEEELIEEGNEKF
uniref:Uncharacterized protein n=2 Tax=Meloidogyne TaxID=189290 RepID=A0A6V7TUH6_MELEN|nr:unnamed protein product [Meloidogyne enterolobii]